MYGIDIVTGDIGTPLAYIGTDGLLSVMPTGPDHAPRMLFADRQAAEMWLRVHDIQDAIVVGPFRY